MASPHILIACGLRRAMAIAFAMSATSCMPSGGSPVERPVRPLNRVIIAGAVQTTDGTPVAGARVIPELLRELAPQTGSCRGLLSVQGQEAKSSRTGQFTIPIEAAGPQTAVCLVTKVFAPPGSGLRDTTVSGQRFFYGIPPTTTIPTVHVRAVLSSK